MYLNTGIPTHLYYEQMKVHQGNFCLAPWSWPVLEMTSQG